MLSGNNNYEGFNTIIVFYVALPDPSVAVTTNGTIVLGSPYTLLCSVTVLEGLVKEPDTTWTRLSVDSNEIDDNYIIGDAFEVQLNIPSLTTSDSGEYTCTSAIDFIKELGLMVSGSNSSIIQLKSMTC